MQSLNVTRLLRQKAAINGEYGASDEGCFVGNQEQDFFATSLGR